MLAFQAGADFAREWAQTRERASVADLLRQPNWRLPRELDAGLLRSADASTGFTRERPELRVLVRAGFWRGLSDNLPEVTGESQQPHGA